ncbi:MAG: hypothetical protein AAF560_31075, partial [Acidobacteriota bacterium]
GRIKVIKIVCEVERNLFEGPVKATASSMRINQGKPRDFQANMRTNPPRVSIPRFAHLIYFGLIKQVCEAWNRDPRWVGPHIRLKISRLALINSH